MNNNNLHKLLSQLKAEIDLDEWHVHVNFRSTALDKNPEDIETCDMYVRSNPALCCEIRLSLEDMDPDDLVTQYPIYIIKITKGTRIVIVRTTNDEQTSDLCEKMIEAAILKADKIGKDPAELALELL